MIVKIFIILMLLAIVGSLFSALLFMFKKKDKNDDRMVRALTWRVGLSLSLFLLLMAGFGLGIISPHGLR